MILELNLTLSVQYTHTTMDGVKAFGSYSESEMDYILPPTKTPLGRKHSTRMPPHPEGQARPRMS